MGNIRSRRGFSLLEAILSISILLLLAGLLLSAVFHVREAASKAACSNQLRQIGLALQQYHNAHSLFPPGMTHLHKSKRSNYAPYGPDVDSFPLLHWHARLLPYLEQENLWALTVKAFSIEPIYLNNPPHEARNQVIALFQCPTEDPNIEGAFNFPTATSYMGVAGTKSRAENGILFLDSRVHLSDVTDGASNTLIAGERPANREAQIGGWYGNIPGGYRLDAYLGVVEDDVRIGWLDGCSNISNKFGPGSVLDKCSLMHFWSVHSGGGHFAFADGSVHFLPYSAAPILPALATRAGGESVAVAYY